MNYSFARLFNIKITINFLSIAATGTQSWDSKYRIAEITTSNSTGTDVFNKEKIECGISSHLSKKETSTNNESPISSSSNTSDNGCHTFSDETDLQERYDRLEKYIESMIEIDPESQEMDYAVKIACTILTGSVRTRMPTKEEKDTIEKMLEEKIILKEQLLTKEMSGNVTPSSDEEGGFSNYFSQTKKTVNYLLALKKKEKMELEKNQLEKQRLKLKKRQYFASKRANNLTSNEKLVFNFQKGTDSGPKKTRVNPEIGTTLEVECVIL